MPGRTGGQGQRKDVLNMKATGIVRRIDDLGRVVIPKEIRRTMRIREGDPLEIYTDREGEVIFKKYSRLEPTSANVSFPFEIAFIYCLRSLTFIIPLDYLM